MENRERVVRVVDPALDDDSVSGVRQNPWRTPDGDDLVSAVGVRVLTRFDRLGRGDRRAALAAAEERVRREGLVDEVQIAHVVFSEAVAVELRRFAEQVGAPPEEVAAELARASRRAASLSGRERSIFFTVCALDDVALGDEIGKVVLRSAVAYQMRWNTAHQHVSRAWRKICEGGPLGAWCGEWRAAHRLICGPTPLELWTAAREYMDACGGRGSGDADAFDAWVKAHEGHNTWFNEWKKQSSRAGKRWRELGPLLDAAGKRPAAVHAAVVQRCAALGIDRWVIPAKLSQQTWSDLIDAAHRPPPTTWEAWRSFLREHAFGTDVEAAFREMEREASLAEVAAVELEHAYRRLLAEAERQSGASIQARDRLRALITMGPPSPGPAEPALIDGARGR